MYSTFNTLDSLFERLRYDKEANGANSSTLNRYPIRFVLFDNFNDQYEFIWRMVTDRGVVHESIANWINPDYPDILITHQTLANKLDYFIRGLNGEDKVVTQFSEIARFYDNVDRKEFDTLIKTIKAFESTDIAWSKHQRIYIPIVGLEAKMSTFKEDTQVTIWYMHNEEADSNQRLILTNKTSYGVNIGTKYFAHVDSVASWTQLWKNEDERIKPNILCESETLFTYGEYAKPDNAFNIYRCHSVHDFLTKGLQLHIDIVYNDTHQEYWEEFAKEIDLDTKFDFEKFVFKHFSVIEISTVSTFLKLWFEYIDSYSRWLLANYYSLHYPDSIIARSLNKMDLYIDQELLTNIALDFTSDPEEIESRRYILNEAAARNLILDEETTSKLVTKLERIAESEGYSEAIRFFTKITSREKELAIFWIGDKKISSKDVKDFYPELFSYLQATDSLTQPEAEWAVKYIDTYKASKIADTISEESSKQVIEFNGNAISFTTWYQRFKTTRSILSSRKDIDVYFWIDGLGIDWISLISDLIKQHNKKNIFLNEVLIARSLLPTTTEINKADLVKMIPESATFIKVGNIDAMAHRNQNTYPNYIVNEIAEVTRAINEVINKYAGKKVAIISDHGLSYLPQRSIGLKLGGYDYHHFGRYATIKKGNITADNNYYPLEDGKTICSLNYNSVGNKINTGQGAHGGCTPEEVLVPIFIISSSPNAKHWKVKLLSEEVIATDPRLRVRIIGVNENECPKLQYNGRIYNIIKAEDGTFISERITNLDPDVTDFTIKIGETSEVIKLNINTGSTIEDQFADFF